MSSSWRRQVGWLWYLQWVRGWAAVGGDEWGDRGTFSELVKQQQLEETGGVIVVPSVTQRISSGWMRQVGWSWYLQWFRGSAAIRGDRWGNCGTFSESETQRISRWDDCGTFSKWKDQQQLEETGGVIVVPSVSQRISSSWRRQVGGGRQHNLQSAYPVLTARVGGDSREKKIQIGWLILNS